MAAAAAAQVPLSGALSDSTTGPLLSGTVYHASTINVPAGQTLTVQPGAVVKFVFDAAFNVHGTLICNGSGANSVFFTDVRDDSVGGDSNGDGNATMPGANWWRGISFSAGSGASVVSGATVRFGGRFIAGFQFDSSNPAMIDCRVEDMNGDGWNLSHNSFPTLTSCAAVRCGDEAFGSVPLAAVPSFSGLTASGNGKNWLSITSATLSTGQSVTVGPQNGLNGAFQLNTSVVVQSGASLALQAGTIFKMAFDTRVDVSGTLTTSGTAGSPVWLTDERDDALGGDSNTDGMASLPAANFWRGITFFSTAGASVLDRASLRYGGRFIAGLELNDSDITIRNCVVRDFSGHAVDFNATSRPTVQGLTTMNCNGAAIHSAEIQSLAGLTGVTSTANALNRINVTQGAIGAGESVTFGPQNGVQGALHFASGINLAAGSALTIQAGAICKFAFDGLFTINGNLQVLGTPAARVWFTDERDDTLGGDSNGDGNASVPAPNWWRGLQFTDTADGSALAFASARYGGRFISAYEISSAAITLNRCHAADFSSSGIDCNNNTEVCLFDFVRIDNCQGPAIEKVSIARVPDFIMAGGTGNQRNQLEVNNGAVSGVVTIQAINQFAGSIGIRTTLSIPAGAELNLQPGVVLKMAFDTAINVSGALSVRGALEDPVIVTEERDDSVGGDSNGDGTASVPAPNFWRGIDLSSAANVSILLGLDVRYGGRFISQLQVRQPTAVLREVRSTFCAGDGFNFAAHPITAQRLVAYANNGDGIEVTGGSFDLRQITSVGNLGVGVRGGAGWSGNVVDSISYQNGGGAYAGIPAGRVRYSNGDPALAGMNGNIFSDPLFVNQAAGDLHLTQSSPCIDTGDPTSPLDGDSTRADMGAYFFNICEPRVFCMQAPHPPCVPTMSYVGFASLTSPNPFFIRLNQSPATTFAIYFYGIGQPIVAPALYGNLCVAGPYQRTGALSAGGNLADGICTGRFEFDFNAWLRSGVDPNIVVGSNVIGHFWYRYSFAPGGSAFSVAIETPVCP